MTVSLIGNTNHLLYLHYIPFSSSSIKEFVLRQLKSQSQCLSSCTYYSGVLPIYLAPDLLLFISSDGCDTQKEKYSKF